MGCQQTPSQAIVHVKGLWHILVQLPARVLSFLQDEQELDQTYGIDLPEGAELLSNDEAHDQLMDLPFEGEVLPRVAEVLGLWNPILLVHYRMYFPQTAVNQTLRLTY